MDLDGKSLAARLSASVSGRRVIRAASMVAMLLSCLLLPGLTAAQPVTTPLVQAVLFYSPSCPHCQKVITEFLIPLNEAYGDQLQIVGIDTTHPTGSVLYGNMLEHFQIPQNRHGVPALIVGSTHLVGSVEIPERFPVLVEEGLAAGGIGWPAIPGLIEQVPDLPPSADPALRARPVSPAADGATGSTQGDQPNAPLPEPTAAAVIEAPQNEDEPLLATSVPASLPTLQAIGRETAVSETVETPPPADPAGFALAWFVLIGMAIALIYALRQIVSARPLQSRGTGQAWLVPLLALLGLGVALYLAYVEITHVEAVCGPVGECNLVQSSPYAQIGGIPVAVLGAVSYLAILALWAGQRLLSPRPAAWCTAGLVLLAVFGTLFSIYLTLLELFAIGAICAWCLSSAVITTLIMVLVVHDATTSAARTRLRSQPAG